MRTFWLVAALAGCGGTSPHATDVKPTLSFAALDDATIQRLVNSAAGADMFAAQDQVEQYSTSTGTCPTIGALGQTITLTGGCTDGLGVTIGGAARIDNPMSWSQVEYDPTQPTQYTFEQLTLTTATAAQSYDGILGLLDNLTTYEADLDVTLQGVQVRSDLYMHCTREGASQLSCMLSTSGVELGGLGGALVSGTLLEPAVGPNVSGSFVLQGADTVTASLSQGCVAYTISDSANAKTCP